MTTVNKSCRIGLAECRYNNNCFKPCNTCVSNQLRDEIRCIEQNAYKRSRVDAINECIKIVEETPWKNADMLVEYFKELL